MKKKIYLVRDYCNAAGIKSEKPMLIELSGKDFYNLVTSLEGERRFFVHLTDDVGYECPEIYAEVSEEEYKDWKSEYDSHLYRKRIKQDYEEVSFDEALLFLYSSDQLISSELTPEEAAEKKEDIERLRRAYKSLDAEDRELIYLLYLCREPLTEKQVASVLHISQQAINKRKMRILRKMKSFWL